MDLKTHILYQKVIVHSHAYSTILQVFERVLREKGLWDAGKARQLAAQTAAEKREGGKQDEFYNAHLCSVFFEKTDYDDVIEYINLARKELLARRILECLNVTAADTASVLNFLNEFCEIPVGKYHVSPTVTLGIRVDLISRFISDHQEYISAAKNHINMRDVALLLSKSVGSVSQPGLVGGKTAGMILANRILRPTLEAVDANMAQAIEETESYFLKSSVAAEFLSKNNLQDCHSLKYLDGESVGVVRQTLEERFMAGKFTDETSEKFRDILAKTEGYPLIMRSSSYLEDSAGHSFSGKYDSVFISNQGTFEERFEELTNAIKKVYLSVYSPSAIEYRRDNNLLDYNERMAVLIQKVVGSRYGKYFFPLISIVGFSTNMYCWSKRVKKEDGMLRIVMGLGTRAVERVGDDYPRMVSLSAPALRPESTTGEQIKYSQRYMDVLNLETRKIETHNFVDLINEIRTQGNEIDLRDIVSIAEDGVLKTPIMFPEKLEYGKCAITFDNLLKGKKFPELMKNVLKKVESSSGMPVDMEFVYHGGKLYVLQCRHLSQPAEFEGGITIPRVAEEDILFTGRRGFSNAIVKDIEYIVFVDDEAYSNLPSAEKKVEISRIVGRINTALEKKRFILMGPGRWGSSNIDLGVPVKYNDINRSRMLIEIARKKGGVTPEVSYGTHFFQDLVEAQIIPLPLYPDEEGTVFNAGFFAKAKNLLSTIVPERAEYEGVIKVIDVPRECAGKRLFVYLDGETPQGVGFVQ